ncbi:hypothetical protein SAMN05216224_107138 [Thioclava dalianensis]|nr:hypothetical protein SAMN05216224_107138 [Thioclava dalianensis]
MQDKSQWFNELIGDAVFAAPGYMHKGEADR